MSSFAYKLKKCRENKKKKNPEYTQAYVAEKIGVARTTYTAYENGTKVPPLETVNALANFFNVSVDYLLGRVLEEKNSSKLLNDPDLEIWYKNLPESDEEELRKLKKIWEMIKDK